MTRFFAMLALLSTPIFVRAQGVITTVAGTGTPGFSGDGGPATSAQLGSASANNLDVTVDKAGNLYIVDAGNQRIRKVNAAGTITTVAGGGSAVGDGGPATGAQIFPGGAAVDGAGDLYFAQGATIRKVNTVGIISTIAGSGNIAYGGDGGPATAAGFNASGVAVDGAGNLYIADSLNSRIRKINPSGIISTVAGNGTPGFSGDGGPATSASLFLPQGLAADSAGNLYFADNSRIRKVDTAGIITTVAGNGSPIGLGEGVPATSTGMVPVWVAVDNAGNLYVADDALNKIRKVSPGGTITSVAGNGTPGFSGDGGSATSASLNNPSSVAVDGAGNIYIADLHNNRIRKVTSSNPAGLSISSSVNALVFNYTIGGTAPASQTVALSSSGAAFSFSAAASTSSGGNWLSVTPPNGTVPATLTVSANVAGVAVGDYTGTIAIVGSGVTNSPLNLTVELHVRASGAQPPPGAPAITPDGVQNAGGYQSKLAPGAVFVVKGSNLGPSSIVTATAPNYPTTLAGSSITLTPVGGGAAISARMVYSLDRQLAAVLPSSVAPGTYAVTATYNNQPSAPQNVTVVPRSFGIVTINSAGTGPAQANDASVNGGISLVRFTGGNLAYSGLNWVLGAAHPGDILTFWGTGGGADPANDTGGSSGDQTNAGNFLVTIAGRQVKPQYAGTASGYPGLWQLNVALPADIPPDCFTAVQVSAGGELSNIVTVAVAPRGQTACSDSQLSQDALARLDAGGTITLGAIGVTRDSTLGTSQESIATQFGRYTAAEWALTQRGLALGSCMIYDRTYPVGGIDPASPDAFLDAGASLAASGPGLPGGYALVPISTPIGHVYGNAPAAGTLASGTYTVSGNGGADIGAFTASTKFPSSFSVTNFDAITLVDRTSPLTFNWTGSGVDQVSILVNSVNRVGSSNHIVTVNCIVPASLGSYTIPATALGYLLPAAATGTSFGAVSVGGMTAPATFTAPLAGGGTVDYTAAIGDIVIAKNVAVQ